MFPNKKVESNDNLQFFFLIQISGMATFWNHAIICDTHRPYKYHQILNTMNSTLVWTPKYHTKWLFTTKEKVLILACPNISVWHFNGSKSKNFNNHMGWLFRFWKIFIWLQGRKVQTGISIKLISVSEEKSLMRIIHTKYEYYKIVLKNHICFFKHEISLSKV